MQKKLHLRCSTRFSIPTSLKLTILTPEQRQANHSYVFIVDFVGRFSKIEIYRWLKYIFPKFLSRKSFYLRKCFANNNSDPRTNEMLYSKVRSGRVVINGKEGFRFNISCCLKIWQSFEMEVCLLMRRGDIIRQTLLWNSKVICWWPLHFLLYLNTEAM